MEASRTAISREHATASQRKLTSGTGTTGEARNAATEASEARAAKATSNARRSLIASSVEPPDTDPYVRWCGRGGVVRRPPIPIRGSADAELKIFELAMFNLEIFELEILGRT